MFSRARAIGFALLLAITGIDAGAPAQGQTLLTGGTIEEIRIEGTRRIEPRTIQSFMEIEPGDPFDAAALNRGLKNLFDTGLFADVTMRRVDDTLIVTVVENPIISRIAFEGNDFIKDETLNAEVELRPRVVFTRTKVQNDVQRILEVYRRNGRFAATVEPKVIQLEQNRVDLVFEIREGEETDVEAINFVGNREFSDSTLRGEIVTSEDAFWRILNTTDTYDPDRLSFDQELLRRFYLKEGYADFAVQSVVAELTPDRSGFIITFTVEEGERYQFGEINIESNLKNVDPEELRSLLETEEGEWYDATLVEDTISALTDAVANRGFAFVEVRPRANRDRENKTIGITYEINEGPKVFVERIDIEGNVRTLDQVIRREFLIVEGDAFNSSKLRRSRSRVQRLGFFGTVEVDNVEGSAPDRTVVTVEVQEQSTGELSFGGGFSTESGPVGTIGVRERNLLGRAQDIRLNFQLAGESSQIDLSFTEPFFLDRRLSAGFDIFRITSEQDESSFEEERLGGSLRTGYELQEDLRQVLRYTFERRELQDIDSDASRLIRAEEGVNTRSAVGQELIYDTRDSIFDPREGLRASLENQVAGLGGNVRFLKSTLGGTYYLPVFEEMTFSVRGESGYIVGIGQDTRVIDRFFLSSRDIRGFEFGGIGPRDARTDDALGGEQYYLGSLQLAFPLGLPDEFDIRGRVFTDFGAAWGIDSGNVRVDDSASPRVSIGTGLSWNSPLGPIELDLGFAVVKEDFDETEVLSFSFGTTF